MFITFFRIDQIFKSIFSSIEAGPREAYREERRVITDHVHEAEWGQVGGLPCRV